MKLLHILSESDSDAFFYERIAERVTGSSFTPCDIRLRKGDGESKVRASIKLLLSNSLKTRRAPNLRCFWHWTMIAAQIIPELLTILAR